MANSLEGYSPTGGQLFPISAGAKDYFNIPLSMAEEPTLLDKVIDEMGKYTVGEQEIALDGFSSFLKSQGYEGLDPYWRTNLKIMRKMVKQGRDTIWTFIFIF